MDSLFVSIAEFARLFSLSKSKAHAMVKEGEVKSARIGTWRIVIPREEVTRFADELREQAGLQA